jgi:decaprenyl-phosphate phosphoribosyltransferase
VTERTEAPPARPVPGPGLSAGAVLRLLRPRQWVKNLLVFAAPAAAGVLDEVSTLVHTTVVFAAFCLAASGTYCLNDAADAEADRLHPTKRFRPVASGAVSASTARVLGVVLLVASIGVGAATGGWEVPAVTLGYVALTTSYTYWLKHVAVVDIVVVAFGFVIRAVAGVAGTDIPISDWYLIVASFGSLFLVAGKRTTELRLGDGADGHRPALAAYTPSFLTYVRSVASGVTLLAYCLWAFEKAGVADAAVPWFELSIIPFALGILRYALILESDGDHAPEDIVLGDRALQAIGLAWAALIAAGVYLAEAPLLT